MSALRAVRSTDLVEAHPLHELQKSRFGSQRVPFSIDLEKDHKCFTLLQNRFQQAQGLNAVA